MSVDKPGRVHARGSATKGAGQGFSLNRSDNTSSANTSRNNSAGARQVSQVKSKAQKAPAAPVKEKSHAAPQPAPKPVLMPAPGRAPEKPLVPIQPRRLPDPPPKPVVEPEPDSPPAPLVLPPGVPKPVTLPPPAKPPSDGPIMRAREPSWRERITDLLPQTIRNSLPDFITGATPRTGWTPEQTREAQIVKQDVQRQNTEAQRRVVEPAADAARQVTAHFVQQNLELLGMVEDANAYLGDKIHSLYSKEPLEQSRPIREHVLPSAWKAMSGKSYEAFTNPLKEDLEASHAATYANLAPALVLAGVGLAKAAPRLVGIARAAVVERSGALRALATSGKGLIQGLPELARLKVGQATKRVKQTYQEIQAGFNESMGGLELAPANGVGSRAAKIIEAEKPANTTNLFSKKLSEWFRQLWDRTWSDKSTAPNVAKAVDAVEPPPKPQPSSPVPPTGNAARALEAQLRQKKNALNALDRQLNKLERLLKELKGSFEQSSAPAGSPKGKESRRWNKEMNRVQSQWGRAVTRLKWELENFPLNESELKARIEMSGIAPNSSYMGSHFNDMSYYDGLQKTLARQLESLKLQIATGDRALEKLATLDSRRGSSSEDIQTVFEQEAHRRVRGRPVKRRNKR